MRAFASLGNGTALGLLCAVTCALTELSILSISAILVLSQSHVGIVDAYGLNVVGLKCRKNIVCPCTFILPSNKKRLAMFSRGNHRSFSTSLFDNLDAGRSKGDINRNNTFDADPENFVSSTLTSQSSDSDCFPSKVNGFVETNGKSDDLKKPNGDSNGYVANGFQKSNGKITSSDSINGEKSEQNEISTTAPELNRWTTLMADGASAALQARGKSKTKEEDPGVDPGADILKDMSSFDENEVERYWGKLQPKLYYLEDTTRVKYALSVAYRAHRGQMRKSGEPFIIHPVEVSCLLADLKMDAETVIAGLLHDTVEDTHITFTQVEAMFGYVVRSIVEGETKVSKLPKLAFSDYADEQAENLRQMFVAMSDDYRIIIVKLADRLHNMRTLKHMKPAKQQKISRETLDIFAPLAHRMGIWQFKAELEDTAFMYLYPTEYQRLNERLQQHQTKFQDTLDKTKELLEKTLGSDATLKNQTQSVKVFGRTKELYSLWLKMKAKSDHDFDHIADVVALRVILFPKHAKQNDLGTNGIRNEENNDRGTVWLCYHVLGLVQHLPGFQPVPTRVKDYISFPKPNGYQALHTELMLDGQTIEVQIRTAAMHRVAEYGMAAHWAYTDEKKRNLNNKNDLYNTPWLSSIKEWQNDIVSSRDFVECVRRELLGKRVFVFLRDGKILNLARGATVVDAAFQIHTEVGLKMHGAQINGKHVPLSYDLQNGDVVSILTGDGRPALDWMRYAKIRSTRSKLRSYFRGKQRESFREAGEILLLDFLARHRDLIVSETFLETPVPSTLEEIGELLPGKTTYHDIDDLLIAIGKRHEWDFLRSVSSKLLKVPLNVLIDADEDQNRSVSRNVYSAVFESKQDINGEKYFDDEEDEDLDDDIDEQEGKILESETSTLNQSSASTMLDILNENSSFEDVDFEYLCRDCLPMIGDEIVGTRLLTDSRDSQDIPATVHRSACPHALRAINKRRAMISNNIPINNEHESMKDMKKTNNKDYNPCGNTIRKARTQLRRFSNNGNAEYDDEVPVKVQWPDSSDMIGVDHAFLIEVVVTSYDRKLLLADCGEIVSEIADIVKTASTTINNISTFEYLVKVKCTDHLQKLMDALSEVNSVMSVERRFGSNLFE